MPIQVEKTTLILGLGNPLLSDDSAGWRVAEGLQQKLILPNITIEKTSLGSLDILELLIGYESAVLIDAIKTETGKAGSIYRLLLDDIWLSKGQFSVHAVNLAAAIDIGKKLGLVLPKCVHVISIEVLETSTFSYTLTPEVESAISACIDLIASEFNLCVTRLHKAGELVNIPSTPEDAVYLPSQVNIIQAAGADLQGC